MKTEQERGQTDEAMKCEAIVTAFETLQANGYYLHRANGDCLDKQGFIEAMLIAMNGILALGAPPHADAQPRDLVQRVHPDDRPKAATGSFVSGKFADAQRSTPAPQRWQIACPSWHQADRPIICSWCNGTGLVAIYLAKDIDHGSEGDVPAQPPINGLDSIHLSQSEFREPLEQAEQATRNRDAILRSAAVPPGAADAREPQIDAEKELKKRSYALFTALHGQTCDRVDYATIERAMRSIYELGLIAPAAPRDAEEINGLDSVHLSTPTPTVLHPSDELRALAAELRAEAANHRVMADRSGVHSDSNLELVRASTKEQIAARLALLESRGDKWGHT